MNVEQIVLKLVEEVQLRDGEAHQTDLALYGQQTGQLPAGDIFQLVDNTIRPALDRLAQAGKIRLVAFCRNTFVVV